MSGSIRLRPRREVLQEINRMISAECPWFEPITDERELGMHSKNETEIIGIADVDARKWHAFAHVVFQTYSSDGKFGTHTVRISKPTAIVYATINGKLLLSYQCRLAIGSKWTLELPRGWVSPEDAQTPETAVRALLTRECGAQFVASLKSFRPVKVAEVWEDSGTRRGAVPIYFLESETTHEPVGRHNECKPRLFGPNEVFDVEEKGILKDAFSFAAMYKVRRYLECTVQL